MSAEPQHEPDDTTSPTIVEVPEEAVARITARHERMTAEEASRRIQRSGVATGALHAEEAARARGFGRVVAVITVVALVSFPVLDGHPLMENVMYVAVTAVLGVALWVSVWGGRDENYRTWVFRLFGACCVGIATLAEVYFGVFSPTPLIVTMGIAFFGQGRDAAWAIGLSLSAVVLYLVLAGLITAGTVPDVGLFPSYDTPLAARVFMVVMVPVVCAVTLWQARLSRLATLEAVARSQQAQRLAGERAAQLDEVKQDLDDVLRAGAGAEGRYTGADVGRYRLGGVVGRGAMGEVYEATDTGTGQPAAVKLMNVAAQDNPELVRRFLREASHAARIDEPHVARVYDAGRAMEGSPFIAMELLTGHDLAELLREKGTLPLADVVRMVEHVAQGLDAAHREGIIHRDLKPHNLFLAASPDGAPIWKILDFGVSKLRGTEGTLTGGGIVGTPGYMAPEQARSGEAGPQADVFALGAVVYRALTGRPPFPGGGTPQILFDVVYRMPVRPTELAGELPKGIDSVLAVAMAKRPEARFESASAFAEALAGAAKGVLDPAVADRARRLLSRLGWGQVRGGDS